MPVRPAWRPVLIDLGQSSWYRIKIYGAESPYIFLFPRKNIDRIQDKITDALSPYVRKE